MKKWTSGVLTQIKMIVGQRKYEMTNIKNTIYDIELELVKPSHSPSEFKELIKATSFTIKGAAFIDSFWAGADFVPPYPVGTAEFLPEALPAYLERAARANILVNNKAKDYLN